MSLSQFSTVSISFKTSVASSTARILSMNWVSKRLNHCSLKKLLITCESWELLTAKYRAGSAKNSLKLYKKAVDLRALDLSIVTWQILLSKSWLEWYKTQTSFKYSTLAGANETLQIFTTCTKCCLGISNYHSWHCLGTHFLRRYLLTWKNMTQLWSTCRLSSSRTLNSCI